MKKLKCLSYNVNGIRSALTKGLGEWLARQEADILCLQEVKADEVQVDLTPFRQLGYTHVHWLAAEKKGYSGVAIFSRIPFDNVHLGMGIPEYDFEGRLIRADLGELALINTYMPSGTAGDVRQDFKYRWLNDFFAYIEHLKSERKQIVICGDFNICHTEIDIHNPVRLKNTSGFLPEERAWVSKLLESGFVDVFRLFNPSPDNYTWWSYRAGSRQKNLGWRIDYFLATENLRERVIDAQIFPDAVHSDHCPVSLVIEVD